jgi:CRP-like cAMP-binding protein
MDKTTDVVPHLIEAATADTIYRDVYLRRARDLLSPTLDLVRLAQVVHERDYADGDYICEEGRPGAALFVVPRGVVEVVRRGADTPEVPLALLEPPASFEKAAAIGTGWFSEPFFVMPMSRRKEYCRFSD